MESLFPSFRCTLSLDSLVPPPSRLHSSVSACPFTPPKPSSAPGVPCVLPEIWPFFFFSSSFLSPDVPPPLSRVFLLFRLLRAPRRLWRQKFTFLSILQSIANRFLHAHVLRLFRSLDRTNTFSYFTKRRPFFSLPPHSLVIYLVHPCRSRGKIFFLSPTRGRVPPRPGRAFHAFLMNKNSISLDLTSRTRQDRGNEYFYRKIENSVFFFFGVKFNKCLKID